MRLRSAPPSAPPRPAVSLTLSLLLACSLIGLRLFAGFWFSESPGATRRIHCDAQPPSDDWIIESLDVSSAVERTLAADRADSLQFTSPDGEILRLFHASRASSSEREVGLFVHTPDRCWIESGWTREPANPDVVPFHIDGETVRFERRLFRRKGHSELVYFAGLIEGRPLEYRLNHYLAANADPSNRPQRPGRFVWGRLTNPEWWRYLTEVFRARHRIEAPRQMIRISTPVQHHDLPQADARIARYLEHHLHASTP